MMRKPIWEAHDIEGARLRTGMFTLYVEPGEGGYRYRVGARWQLRYSIKPVPTLAEAKAQAVRVAVRLLNEQIKTLEGVGE